ncbi:MAG TPA: ABC transporter permease, partial [Gaiellales bacterium]|nr:ABC transporter permease [Gaiellales bacterium]
MPETPTAVQSPPQSTGTTDREFTVAQRSQFQLVFRRFLRHRAAMISLVVLLLVVLLAFVGGALWKYAPGEITPDNSAKPSWDHPFGTDAVGKDQFAQVLRGTRISLGVAVLVALLATAAGTIWGAVAAYFGGTTDSVMMRIADLILTLPLVAVAAMLGHNFGGSWWLIAFVIAGLYWAYVARVARGVVLSLREKEFVEAAKALGASDWRIISRHLIPNALGSVIVNATILV